jgi:uncharacterized membrane protein YkvA (DUF1232 family)
VVGVALFMLGLIVGYAFSPIDPLPDFLPGVGLLDEMVVVPIGVLIAAKLIPRNVLEECREKAREVAEGEKPVSRVAAVVVVAVWLLWLPWPSSWRCASSEDEP